MCGIICCCGKVDGQAFEEGFARTFDRGPDMTRVEEIGGGIMGFHRLAIMGLSERGMQPFRRGESAAVCNGELYGFRKMKKALEDKGYSFSSGSDCELILPLYAEYGADMFGMLDAEFAMVVYDGKAGEWIAARDPIGIRPLYWGKSADGVMCFASEARNLTPFCTEVMPFPPGHYWKGGELVCYCDITKVEEKARGDLDEICGNIREKLIAGVEKRLDSDAPVGFLLSGGLDSSLVCSIAARKLGKIRTFAVGMRKDAIDLKYAREVAEYIGSEHTEVYMTFNDVLSALEEVIYSLGTFDITTIRASLGMFILCREIRRRSNVRVLLTGEISDELFGYKYTDFAPNAREFQKESEKRVRELHMYDVLRADRCISSASLEARVPFGDLNFVRYVMSIDPKLKMNSYGMGKYLLRKAFAGDFLPENILWREKAAFSDAVGHSMVDLLKEEAEKRFTDEEFAKKSEKYAYHCKPFTKESLMYREIFERYYPGGAKMIKDFWMPNKSWEGCDVNDPSARVLSNYGKSGK